MKRQFFLATLTVALLTVSSIAQSTQGRSDTPQQQPTGPPLRVRISQKVSTGLLIQKVRPRYPDDARQARIQGTVVLKVQIDANGDVEDLSVVSGHPMLAPAALEAVKQWKYKPFLLNGQPMKVETQVTVTFKLSPRQSSTRAGSGTRTAKIVLFASKQ